MEKVIVESILHGFDVINLLNERLTPELITKLDIVLFDVVGRDIDVIANQLLELKQTLRSSTNNLPIIIAVIDLNIVGRAEIFNFGFDDFICKPMLPAELTLRVKQAIYSRGTNQCTISLKETTIPKECTPKNRTSPEYVLVENATNYLLSQLNQQISLSKLTKKVGTNRNKLSHAFKTYYGETPHSWVRRQRLTLAAQLLVTTDLSIHNIAIDVGYPDPNNFSTAFKKHYNVSPVQFRGSRKQLNIA